MTAPVDSRATSWPKFLLVLVACFAAFGLVLAVAFDAVATYAARQRLERERIRCDERLDVDVAWTFTSVAIAPTRCTVERGPIAAFELLDPATLTTAGEGGPSMSVPRARLELRVDPKTTAAAGADSMLTALQIPQRLVALTRAMVELARAPLPDVELGSLELAYQTTILGTLERARVRGKAGEAHIERVRLPVLDVANVATASVQLLDAKTRIAKERVRLDAELSMEATVPVLGAVSRKSPVWIEVTDLERDPPTVTFGF